MRAFMAVVVLLSAGSAHTANSEVLFNVEGEGYVYDAIDGDTFWVNVDNTEVFTYLYDKARDNRHFRPKYQSIKMRLGNTNTAESEHQDKWRNTAEGARTSQLIRQITAKRRVRFHCWDIGDYNRPICSLRFNQVGDLGVFLIENGFSDYITKYGYSPRMHKEYSRAAMN